MIKILKRSGDLALLWNLVDIVGIITFVCIKWWKIPSIDETIIIPFKEVLSKYKQQP
jgi:hypothetical protein